LKPIPLLEERRLDRNVPLAISFPFLALLTPFTVYVADRGYPLMSPEVLLILAAMLCISTMIGLVRSVGGSRTYAISVSGLLIAGADYLFEWVTHGSIFLSLVMFAVFVALVRRFEHTTTLVVTAFLCVFVVSTLLRNGSTHESSPVSVVMDVDGRTDGPPRLIHLILDEHLGIEGIPTDSDYARELKQKIKHFYHRYGFELFGGAYSRYWQTVDSIPNLLNFSTENVIKHFVTGDRPPYSLQQNRYFQFLDHEGYQIHVVDGNYLDFCTGSSVQLRSCTKYHWYPLDKVAKLDLPILTKTATLMATFVARSHGYQNMLHRYEQRVRPFLLSNGVAMPVVQIESLWAKRRLDPFSVNSMAALDELTPGILQLGSGHVLFAHLMLPHYPYVFREDCSPRSIPESMDNMEGVSLALRTTEGKTIRFDQYLRQVECLYVKLDELFQKMQSAGVFDDSIIIVHGDHGSRLGLHHLISREQQQLTAEDYTDGLSTLFATKVPGRPSGYDPSLHAIDELLVQTIRRAFGKDPPLFLPRQEPFAYLETGHGKELLLVDMPWRPLSTPDSSMAVQ
jgi:hypothetical protein